MTQHKKKYFYRIKLLKIIKYLLLLFRQPTQNIKKKTTTPHR